MGEPGIARTTPALDNPCLRGVVMADRTAPSEVRFWRFVDDPTSMGCWPWQGHIDQGGYGTLWLSREKRRGYAHRFAYEMLVGPIPAGLWIDHLCRNRSCVNPAHLEAVTPKENTRRGLKGPRSSCINGHEFTPENTYITPCNGKRQCRECGRERQRRMRKGRRATS